MITEFKIFESLKEVELQNNFANAIVDLFEAENITAQNNFYDVLRNSYHLIPARPYTEDDPSYIFNILDFYKNEIIMRIEYFKTEPWISIRNYKEKNENVNNFIKYVLNEFDKVWQGFGTNWAIDNFDLVNLPEAIKMLSVDNYIMWKDAKRYNL